MNKTKIFNISNEFTKIWGEIDSVFPNRHPFCYLRDILQELLKEGTIEELVKLSKENKNLDNILYAISCVQESYKDKVKFYCSCMNEFPSESNINSDLLDVCRTSDAWNEKTYTKLLNNIKILKKRKGSDDITANFYTNEQDPDMVESYIGLTVGASNKEQQLWENWKEYWRMIHDSNFNYFNIPTLDWSEEEGMHIVK